MMKERAFAEKSTVEEIRARFDQDVERFARLDLGQTTTVDARLAMELISKAAVATTPRISRALDIGCGAGNNLLALLGEYDGIIDCDLCDLSWPMLVRAKERLTGQGVGQLRLFQKDFRDFSAEEPYDVILAAAVLHHLRGEQEWREVFAKIYRLLRPGGSFWVTDFICHSIPAVQELMWQRYGDFLKELGGEDYREKVFAYIDKEDSPRSVFFQMKLMQEVGFAQVDLLHKNSCFAAFGGMKATSV